MFFELEDIKRRHTPYWDEYNTGSWITTPDSSFSWNYQRGLIAGITAATLNESQILFSECAKLLLRKYEWPNSLKQYGIFAREIFKMENWKKGIKNRLQYALTIGATDFAARISVFRATHSGWYRPYNSFDVNFIRKIPTSIFAGAVTSWIGVPFEMAKLAYYADKTFPKELQRGYTSYWNALRRIPFEEGPYYLFKNTFPFVMRNFFQTVSLFFTYDWIKNQLTVLFRNADFPLFPVKVFAATTAVYFASIFSYPWGEMIREMVDYWPKEKNGVCTWGGNYRRAAVWLWYHEFTNNYYPGLFTNYFWRHAPAMFTYLWIADSLGMFTYWSHNYHAGGGSNTWEDAFA